MAQTGYVLEQTGEQLQEILNNATPQSELAAEQQRAEAAEQQLQTNIDAEQTRAEAAEQQLQTNIDAEQTRAEAAEQQLQSNIDDEETRAKAAEKQNADDIDAIESVIPNDAASGNKLATEGFVNSSVATATATYRGAYNLVTDLHLAVDATRVQIAAALAGTIAVADNNDYAFVQIPTSADTPTEIAAIDRYKYNGTAWSYEYTLNNSGFTAAQWAAINSGITSGLVAKLLALPTNSELTTLLQGKADASTTYTKAQVDAALALKQAAIDAEELARQQADTTLQGNIDDEETRAKAAEQANAGDIDALEALVPSAASPQNQLADKQFVNSSISTSTATYRGAYNLVTDLHLTIDATRAAIATALAATIVTADNNDYSFVQVPTANGTPTEIARVERYKYNGTAWAFEYELNNSGFTAEQWDAINSTITSALVAKLNLLPSYAELTIMFGTKQDVITDLQTIRLGAQAGAAAAPQATTYTKAEVDAMIANFITASTTALVNYYLKSDTYTKTEVQELISAIKQFQYQSVQTLPTASAETMGIIYLVPSTNPQQQNVKDEYITTATTDQGLTTYAWEQIGTTTVDLSGYYTSQQTDAAINAALANYSTTQQMTAAIVAALVNYYTKTEVDTALALKQDTISDLATIRSGAQAGAAAAPQATTYSKTEVDGLIANFITASTSALVNYYLKSDTYSAMEIDQMIAAVKQFTYEAVQTLPTASASTMNKIYLVPSASPQTQNVKDEFITLSMNEGGETTYYWECIGSTEVNLTNYYTKAQTDSEIASAINTALASYSTTSQVSTIVSTAITTALANYYTKAETDAAGINATRQKSVINTLTAKTNTTGYAATDLIQLYANDGTPNGKINRSDLMGIFKELLPGLLTDQSSGVTNFLSLGAGDALGKTTLANAASLLGVNAVTKAFNEPPALSDANTTVTGVYRTTNSTAHAAGVGIIFAASSGLNIIQLFMKSDNVIYMRVAVGGDFTNANWKEL